MRRLLGLGPVIVVCLAFIHCGEQSCPPDRDDLGYVTSQRRPESSEIKYYDESTLATSELTGLDNEFGFRIFKEIVELHPDENVVISPLSISMALGMATNGAAGTTIGSPSRTVPVRSAGWWSALLSTRKLIIKDANTPF
jgi:hypothetical protein